MNLFIEFGVNILYWIKMIKTKTSEIVWEFVFECILIFVISNDVKP